MEKMISFLKEDLKNLTTDQLRDYTVALKNEKPVSEMEQTMLQSALDMMCKDMPISLRDESLEMVATVEYTRIVSGGEAFRITQSLKKLYGGIR